MNSGWSRRKEREEKQEETEEGGSGRRTKWKDEKWRQGSSGKYDYVKCSVNSSLNKTKKKEKKNRKRKEGHLFLRRSFPMLEIAIIQIPP